MFKPVKRLAVAFSFLLIPFSTALAFPPGFVESPIGGTWNEAVGITFASDGRMLVWERGGKVWIVENGARDPAPLVDLSEEVGGWRDFGLLGFALHPNFLSNGYIYLLYVVDRHHLLYYGTGSYNPAANEYFNATIGRLTRYTARPADNFHSVDPASRLVLVGESIDQGIPILHQSHGVGSLVFGADGTLLISTGDSASYQEVDTGGQVAGGYVSQGLADGIIRPKENVGSYRAQLVDCLCGKILRVDPNTGDGLPSNPFYDAGKPRSARSRVWALGLRNPFRMTSRPGTGSHNPADGDPGALYIGDVGWSTWEELDVCVAKGQNFGWPAFEGLEAHSGYWSRNTSNLDAPNPLYGTGGCTQQYFYFRDLIQQETLNPDPVFPNPCNTSQSIPSSIPTFIHTRPAIDWRHGSGPSRTGIFVDGNAAVIDVGAVGSPVSGPQFGGNCSVGGVWYTGADFPAQYRNTYFHGEYGGRWIKCFTFDQNNDPVAVQDFDTGGIEVALATHPITGALYHIDWSSQVLKISYQGTGNQAPIAVATSSVKFGPGPLAVQFQGSGSSDPEGFPLIYSWDFGDGAPASSLADPAHTFDAPAGVPTSFTVTLTVADNQGATAQAQLLISANNTPPVVNITSPADGTKGYGGVAGWNPCPLRHRPRCGREHRHGSRSDGDHLAAEPGAACQRRRGLDRAGRRHHGDRWSGERRWPPQPAGSAVGAVDLGERAGGANLAPRRRRPGAHPCRLPGHRRVCAPLDGR
ncbi:MAG: PQQ-dependent sugar dehydrogenase [Planctomycetes bacterium]|nr:PQQ-dependent sugar dehydrogenase [Planctomycetota bacterium]